jgi:hypothetical protein
METRMKVLTLDDVALVGGGSEWGDNVLKYGGVGAFLGGFAGPEGAAAGAIIGGVVGTIVTIAN